MTFEKPFEGGEGASSTTGGSVPVVKSGAKELRWEHTFLLRNCLEAS